MSYTTHDGLCDMDLTPEVVKSVSEQMREHRYAIIRLDDWDWFAKVVVAHYGSDSDLYPPAVDLAMFNYHKERKEWVEE